MSIDDRVQNLADTIGRPVIVFDADFRVVAFSVHSEQVDSARLSMILSRRGSDRATAMIRQHEVDRSPGAVVIPVVDGSPARVVAALRYQGRVSGYVSYVPTGPTAAEDRDSPTIQAQRDELGAQLAARAAEEREGNDHVETLVSGLLEGDSRERESAAGTLVRSAMISESSVYATMVFAVGDEEHPDPAMTRLILDRALSRISSITSRTSLGTVINGHGILIIPHEVNPQRLRDLIAGMWFPGARGGGGSVRNRLVDVHGSWREAQIALRATGVDPDYYGATAVWEELGVDRILLQLPLARLTRDDLPAAVHELLELTGGADLAATLEAYLDNGADAQRTAKALHIHRSTLYYRLDRIRSIVESDLSDGRVRRELHTALRVATLAHLR